MIPVVLYNQLQEITNICSSIQQPCHPCIGYYLDEAGKICGVYPAIGHSHAPRAQSITLGEVLSNGFNLDVVYTLAITLTASLLQLSLTPWLYRPWSKQDIAFLGAEHASEVSIDLKHPYLTRVYNGGE